MFGPFEHISKTFFELWRPESWNVNDSLFFLIYIFATSIFILHESINEGVDSHGEFTEDSCNKSGSEGNNIKINSYQVTCAGGD